MLMHFLPIKKALWVDLSQRASQMWHKIRGRVLQLINMPGIYEMWTMGVEVVADRGF